MTPYLEKYKKPKIGERYSASPDPTKIKTEEEDALQIAARLLLVLEEGDSLYISVRRKELIRLCLGLIKTQNPGMYKKFTGA